jgi:hypothetical protein
MFFTACWPPPCSSPGSTKKQAAPEENAESLPLRKEEKSERKPSGFPFAFHHPPAGDGPPRGPNAKKGQQHNSVLLPFLVETGGLEPSTSCV